MVTSKKTQGVTSLALHRHLACIFVFVTAMAGSAEAQMVGTEIAAEAGTSWLEQIWMLPVFRFFAPALPVVDSIDLDFYLPEAPAVPACLVEPLPAIEDQEALAFESGAPVDVDGLTPRTALALNRFERLVSSVGGSIFLTSAYRPAAYQDHLQQVWDKWMLEMRDNYDENCADIKAATAEEFTRHQLLEKQRPVSMSDHTRGISFDAAVLVPRGRRRPSLDALARRAGFKRPAIAKDPVHFRLIAGV
jgi:hypothetical protein